MNTVTLIGRLGKDPEEKIFENGNVVSEFSVADSEYFVKDGEKQEKTIWINVKAFGRVAEICNEFLYKGAKVGITGRITQETWESEGKTKSVHKIIAERIELLEKKETNGDTEPKPKSKDKDPF